MSRASLGLPIMTIVGDPARAALLRSLVQDAGLAVVAASGALHALTQLERNPVSAIICDAEMEDMTGNDFREVVLAEAHTKDVPVHVLPALGAEAEAGGVPTTPQLLAGVLEEIGVEPEDFPVPLRSGAAPHLHGDLSQFSLPEFLNWVAEMRFSGHWLVTVSTPHGTSHLLSGYLAMRDGNAVYAECGGQSGKAALFTLLYSIEKYHDAMFRFYRADVPAQVQSPDLTTTTPRLLIELAVDLDHHAAGHGTGAHGAHLN